ncbi:MAG: TetR/AcrR family transcriptional regulator [Acidimicrobiales bacterium]
MTTPDRSYTSPLRDDQARLTRRRIIGAAHDLFLTQGYAGTTIETIARTAGVSVQTVYNSVGNKAAVLAAVYDTTLAGDDAPVAIAERSTFQAMLTERDARRCLARYAALSRELSQRAAPLVATILAEAGNPELRALAATIDQQRADGTAAVARHVTDRFGLAPGLTVDEAADILWALTAPETMIRLVHRRGWTWERYESWLANAMADGVLGHRRRGSPAARR